MALIFSEALLLGLMGGLLGILIARGMISVLTNVPFLGDVLRAFPNLGLSPQIASLGWAWHWRWDCWRDSFRRSPHIVRALPKH